MSSSNMRSLIVIICAGILMACSAASMEEIRQGKQLIGGVPVGRPGTLVGVRTYGGGGYGGLGGGLGGGYGGGLGGGGYGGGGGLGAHLANPVPFGGR